MIRKKFLFSLISQDYTAPINRYECMLLMYRHHVGKFSWLEKSFTDDTLIHKDAFDKILSTLAFSDVPIKYDVIDNIFKSINIDLQKHWSDNIENIVCESYNDIVFNDITLHDIIPFRHKNSLIKTIYKEPLESSGYFIPINMSHPISIQGYQSSTTLIKNAMNSIYSIDETPTSYYIFKCCDSYYINGVKIYNDDDGYYSILNSHQKLYISKLYIECRDDYYKIHIPYFDSFMGLCVSNIQPSSDVSCIYEVPSDIDTNKLYKIMKHKSVLADKIINSFNAIHI